LPYSAATYVYDGIIADLPPQNTYSFAFFQLCVPGAPSTRKLLCANVFVGSDKLRNEIAFAVVPSQVGIPYLLPILSFAF